MVFFFQGVFKWSPGLLLHFRGSLLL